MGLQLKLTLPISAENQGLINIIALKDGWVDGTLKLDGTPYTATDVNVKLLSNFIANKVSEAFDWYYGASQSVTKQQVLDLLANELVVTFENV